MGHALGIDTSEAIVELRLYGSMPHDEHLAAREQLITACRERRLRAALIDARDLVIAGDASPMDLFDFAESWPMAMGEPRLRLAGVLPRDAYARAQVLFGDTVAFNRGVQTRVFERVEEARAWLRGSEAGAVTGDAGDPPRSPPGS